MATRTDAKKSHQGRQMFASNEIDQDAGGGRRGEALTRTEQPVTSLMRRGLAVDWNIKGKKGGESGGSRKRGQLSDVGEDVRSGTQSNIK